MSGLTNTFPTMVLKRHLPCLWNGCWWTTDLHSLSALQRRTSPDPLQTQCPAGSISADSLQFLGSSSVYSTWDCRPFGSIGLPCSSGSILVSCRSSYTMDFRTFGCTSSLHPFDSVGLHLPCGAALVLTHTGSTSVFGDPGSTSLAQHRGFALASRNLECCPVLVSSCLFLSLQLSWLHR